MERHFFFSDAFLDGGFWTDAFFWTAVSGRTNLDGSFWTDAVVGRSFWATAKFRLGIEAGGFFCDRRGFNTDSTSGQTQFWIDVVLDRGGYDRSSFYSIRGWSTQPKLSPYITRLPKLVFHAKDGRQDRLQISQLVNIMPQTNHCFQYSCVINMFHIQFQSIYNN